MRFVDTNVLLYAVSRSASERRKSEIANDILRERDLALSVEVLQEFFVQATRSTRADALTHQQAADLVAAFTRFVVQPTTVGLVQAAIATHHRFRIGYWDAAVIEAARALGCTEVLSEDLGHGQDYGGVVARNPFL